MRQIQQNYILCRRSNKARQLIDKSLLINIQQRGESNITTATRHVCLAQIHIETGQYEEALKLLEPCFIMHEKHYKPSDNRIGWVSHHLANAYKLSGNFDKATLCFERSLTNYDQHYGKNHTEYAAVLRDFGHMFVLKKDYEKAEEMLLQALKIFEAHNHPEAYRCHEYLGELYTAKEDKVRAQKEYMKALVIAKSTFPKDSAHITRLQHLLAK